MCVILDLSGKDFCLSWNFARELFLSKGKWKCFNERGRNTAGFSLFFVFVLAGHNKYNITSRRVLLKDAKHSAF